METYFLNFATNPEAEAVAARENAGSGQSMHKLPDIVRAIALNNKIDESRDFAEIVQRAMVRRLSPRNKTLRDIGVKQAPFVVLIGASMPSVLAEMSFVTNKQDALLLKTAGVSPADRRVPARRRRPISAVVEEDAVVDDRAEQRGKVAARHRGEVVSARALDDLEGFGVGHRLQVVLLPDLLDPDQHAAEEPPEQESPEDQRAGQADRADSTSATVVESTGCSTTRTMTGWLKRRGTSASIRL